MQVESALGRGLTVMEISRQLGISPNALYRYKNGGRTSGGEIRKMHADLRLPAVKTVSRMQPEAQRALTDFAYWRERYLGRVPTPWQEKAGYKIVELLETEDEEYLVMNVPPGAGKSTILTDICTWVLCRDRSTRILYGSATQNVAADYTRRIQNNLEREEKYKATSREILRGLSVDATGSLQKDYGRFKPTNNDLWRKDKFVVAQLGEQTTQEKEASVAAFGRDSAFLGGRFDLNVWDDLVDKKVIRTSDSREHLIEFWDNYAETRVEPGGLVALVGQRLSGDDLYRYALDLKAGENEWVELEDHIGGDPDDRRELKYHHIIFKAHDDERCEGTELNPQHRVGGAAWPEGCLLDPKRVGWKKLSAIRSSKAEQYRIVYQQEDSDPGSALVHPDWVEGGRDRDTGQVFIGCKDRERGLCELPKGLFGGVESYVTADPSPSRYWAIQWWCYHRSSGQRFLMDVERRAMEAPDFLDWRHSEQRFVGVLNEWWLRSLDLGLPISTVIFETNAAQKFLLQYDHTHRWMQQIRAPRIISHETNRNKLSVEYGVQMLGPLYQQGLIRLPWKNQPAQHASMKLIHEVTRWPNTTTDDMVMAQWFGEFAIPRLFREKAPVYRLRPNDYLASKARRGISA